MAAIANYVVFKADGTTNITYDVLSASGGDGSPAVWRQDTGNAPALPVGFRPVFKMWSQWNGPKTARQMKWNFVYPYATQDSTTTLYSVKDRVVSEGIMTIPQSIPLTVIGEAVHQNFNILAAAATRINTIFGYAPT